MTAKAFNGRILTEWLQRCLLDAVGRPNVFTDPNGQLLLLSQCVCLVWPGLSKHLPRVSLNTWHGLQERYGRHMNLEERTAYVDSLLKFTRRYVALAQQAVRLRLFSRVCVWPGLERTSSG